MKSDPPSPVATNSQTNLWKLLPLLSKKFNPRKLPKNILGNVSSKAKAQGLDIRDVRPYVTGDEVRNIDWNVTSRTGEVHVREYFEEKNTLVNCFLDVSSSMDFMVTESLELLKFFSLLEVHRGNPVRCVLYSNQLDFASEPTQQIQSLLAVWKKLEDKIQKIQNFSEVLPSDHTVPLSLLQNRFTKRSLSYWISDFSDLSDLELFRSIQKNHDIRGVCLQKTQTLPPDSDPFYQWFVSKSHESKESKTLGLQFESLQFQDQTRFQRFFGKKGTTIDWDNFDPRPFLQSGVVA